MQYLEKLKFNSVCGICCESECAIYNAYINNDEAMRRQLALTLLNDESRWTEIRCDGCKGEQSICWTNQCPVKACATNRKHEFCIQCDLYPCKTLSSQQRKLNLIKREEIWNDPVRGI